jgi:hypothetical protein
MRGKLLESRRGAVALKARSLGPVISNHRPFLPRATTSDLARIR